MNAERTDIFGRTEQQLVDAIPRAERMLEIQKVWRGNDRLGAEIETSIRLLAMDRRLLAELRGERRSDVKLLEGEPLRKWRADLCRRGSAGIR